ncbi:hypothetical protein PWT90_04388 [Aphanocladium album]|nr:hypothetical protein PWT90_04388 [Aphanocladium album]
MQLTTAFVAGLLSGTALARNIPRAYPGIDEAQSRNAGAAVWQIQQYGLGRAACLAVMATALQESELLVYANPRVPQSMQYRHDREGGDQDSVGMFQQRPQWYPDIARDMDPAGSTAQFLDAMLRVPGWQNMETSALCQEVQKAEAGNRYAWRLPVANGICNAAGF